MTDATLALDTLFQLTGVGVLQTDVETGRLVRANAVFCKMVGYSEADLRGMTYLELTHPDDRERDAANFAALQRGESSNGAALTRCVRKDGVVVWLELHVTVLGEGKEAVNLTVVHDVTERRRADEALCESESRQAFLLALSDELRPLTSPGDVAEAAARRLTERLDVTRVAYGNIEDRKLSVKREDSRGVPSIIGEYDMQPFGDDFLAAYRSDAVITSADVATDARFSDLVKADLATRSIGAFVDVVLFEEDRAVSLFIVQHVAPRAWSEAELNLIREVAERVRTAIERVRAERALREHNATLEQRVEARTEELQHSEQRFSQAFYANPIPACMTTFGRETFVEVNDALLALTGYEREEVVGKTSRELAMWSSPEDQKKRGEAQRNGLGFHNLELGMLTKAREVKNILISAAVIRLNGNGHDGYLKMFYDVTEQRRTQEQMHRAIQEVMSDTGWFSSRVLERLAHVKTGSAEALVPVNLSKREQQVLERLAGGMGNEAIAKDLGLSPQTIRNYVTNLYEKLEVHSRSEAIVWARERGIVGRQTHPTG